MGLKGTETVDFTKAKLNKCSREIRSHDLRIKRNETAIILAGIVFVAQTAAIVSLFYLILGGNV